MPDFSRLLSAKTPLMLASVARGAQPLVLAHLARAAKSRAVFIAADEAAMITGFADLTPLHPNKRLTLESGADEDLTPTDTIKPPSTAPGLDPLAGPVLVTIEYRIAAANAQAFREVMRSSRRSRLSMGVLSWGLFRDTTDPERFTEYFVDETWAEHLRRFDRMTAADLELRARRFAFHLGPEPPLVTRRIAESINPR